MRDGGLSCVALYCTLVTTEAIQLRLFTATLHTLRVDRRACCPFWYRSRGQNAHLLYRQLPLCALHDGTCAGRRRVYGSKGVCLQSTMARGSPVSGKEIFGVCVCATIHRVILGIFVFVCFRCLPPSTLAYIFVAARFALCFLPLSIFLRTPSAWN